MQNTISINHRSVRYNKWKTVTLQASVGVIALSIGALSTVYDLLWLLGLGHQ